MRLSAQPEEYSLARERIQRNLSSSLRSAMATLVCNMENADLLLVAADGKKLPAHECILRARAPGFYQRHVEATVAAMGRRNQAEGRLREVAIGDIDSAGLEFFIHSVYTEDEIARFPSDVAGDSDDRRDSDSRNSHRSYNMEESTDLDEARSEMEESHQSDETPTHPTANDDQKENEDIQGMPHYHCPPTIPQMTSFRDLASGSPMNSSVYSLGGRSEVGPDIPEEDEELTDRERTSSRGEAAMGKFIRLDSFDECEKKPERKRSSLSKSIFPMFIGFGEDEGKIPEGIRGRAIMAKRLSVNSLTSLTSIDMSVGPDTPVAPPDKHPSCRLAADLLQMYLDNVDTDVVIRTANGDLFAHKCMLSALSPFFRQQLKKSPKIEMKGYTKNTVHFLLSFMYGGLTTIPDEVDIWEVVSLATHLNLKHLIEVVILHLKMQKCHWFHRPCASCVSATMDMLPQLHSIRCLRPLYDELMLWQARNFSRIWKSRVFAHLNEKWQRECYDAAVQYMDDETVIEIILGCERLQTSLPRSKSEAAAIVLGYASDLLDLSLQFIVHSFHLVVTSRAFAAQGKGLALNLGLIEELFPPLIHSLSPDTAIKSFIGLSQLRESLDGPPSPKKSDGMPDDWSPRFLQLVHRLYELVDKHVLHFASAMVSADSWHLLSPKEQTRIQETGIFVELRQPKVAPPRLSSFYRTYKRSASAGVQLAPPMERSRAQSMERRTLSRNSPTLATEKENDAKMDESKGTPEKKKAPEEAPAAVRESPRAREGSSSAREKSTTREPSSAREPPSSAREGPSRENTSQEAAPPAEAPKARESSSSAREPPVSRPPSASTTTAPAEKVTPEVAKEKEKDEKKSPVRRKQPHVIRSEEGVLERQQTHTIISVSGKGSDLPGPSPGNSPKKEPTPPAQVTQEKPKSVVKPMRQLAPAAAPATTTQRAPARTTTTTKTSTTTAAKEATRSPARSSIPRKAALPADAKRKPPEATPKGRSPKSARKSTAN